jgi:glucan phosphoethanolaminetransferase (alkaline phosphatase superfamily)
MIPALINLIIWLLIVGILVGLVFWVLSEVPGIPEPIVRLIRVVIVVIVVLVVVMLLLQLVGSGGGMNLPKIVG